MWCGSWIDVDGGGVWFVDGVDREWVRSWMEVYGEWVCSWMGLYGEWVMDVLDESRMEETSNFQCTLFALINHIIPKFSIITRSRDGRSGRISN